jgi:hypothetical protein
VQRLPDRGLFRLGLERGPERCLGPGQIALARKNSAPLEQNLRLPRDRAQDTIMDGQCGVNVAGLLEIERLLVEPGDLRLRWREHHVTPTG